MPLTSKGEKILSNLIEEYGSKEKGEQVLYAGKNKGTFTGIDSIPAGLDEAGNLDRRQSAAELKAVVDALGCAADELCTRFDAYRFRADCARQ